MRARVKEMTLLAHTKEVETTNLQGHGNAIVVQILLVKGVFLIANHQATDLTEAVNLMMEKVEVQIHPVHIEETEMTSLRGPGNAKAIQKHPVKDAFPTANHRATDPTEAVNPKMEKREVQIHPVLTEEAETTNLHGPGNAKAIQIHPVKDAFPTANLLETDLTEAVNPKMGKREVQIHPVLTEEAETTSLQGHGNAKAKEKHPVKDVFLTANHLVTDLIKAVSQKMEQVMEIISPKGNFRILMNPVSLNLTIAAHYHENRVVMTRINFQDHISLKRVKVSQMMVLSD
jgi:hypothetical protein